MADQPGLRVVRAGAAFRGKQGHMYSPAVSAEAVGARALHMQLLEIAPAERAHAHKHEAHETAIHVLKGVSGCFWGERLEHHAVVGAGDFCYIAADVPHLPYNRSATEPVVAVIARTDPNEQESVVLLPELETGVNWSLTGLDGQPHLPPPPQAHPSQASSSQANSSQANSSQDGAN